MGGLLNNETIHHYFIQGVNSASTIREILSQRPVILDNAIQATLEIEIMDTENDWMVRRGDDPILAFIPVYHQDTTITPYKPSPPKRERAPLAIQEPMMLLTALVD